VVSEPPRSDQLDVLRHVVERLDRGGIAYMLSGSLASSYYVEPRMTRDIDLVIEADEHAARLLAANLGEEYYCDVEGAASAAARRGLFNAIETTRLVKVDFVVRKDEPYRRMEFARRRRGQVDGLDLWIVSPEDLVLSKLLWSQSRASALQRSDVRELIRRVDLDWDYLNQWAASLGVDGLLGDIQSE
jgi:hypothetical protein